MEKSNADRVLELVEQCKEATDEETTEILANIDKIVQTSSMKALLRSQTAGNTEYAERLGII